ncbi:flagellar hook-length control protein FliK [Fluviibacterium sp. DFM31]|uniref:Flagellar hook-length control protein FliK n=1 Tax=Meridianimarinicoccus marinus TaxID=3231483 RepID=A0ABV3L6I6_9RHOB
MPMIADSSPAAVSRKLPESHGATPDSPGGQARNSRDFADFMISGDDAPATPDTPLPQAQIELLTEDTGDNTTTPEVGSQDTPVANTFPERLSTPSAAGRPAETDPQLRVTTADKTMSTTIQAPVGTGPSGSDPADLPVDPSVQARPESVFPPFGPAVGLPENAWMAAHLEPARLGVGKDSPSRAEVAAWSPQAFDQVPNPPMGPRATAALVAHGLPTAPVIQMPDFAPQTGAEAELVEAVALPEGVGSGIPEARSTQTAAGLALTQGPARAPAAPVLAQITDAIRMTADGSIDIALSPEELGRVRLVLQASDTGLQVNIQSERSETLDLLRRNIEQLQEDLNAAGFADVNFSFGQSSRQPPSDVPAEDTGAGMANIASEAVDPATIVQLSEANFTELRLNMRL